MSQITRGHCLCGAVRFRVREGPLSDVALCHCGMCRRWHGHIGAYTDVDRAALVFDAQDELAWFQSSSFARRGFCRRCGSSLFWDAPERSTISVAAGTLEAPTRLSTCLQIFTEDRGDYYELDRSVAIRPSSADV